jgi:bifunctional non-homologous end joining protein LigD
MGSGDPGAAGCAQAASRPAALPPAGWPGILYAFDLLELDGQDIRREPLEMRKRTLAVVLRVRAGAGIQSTIATTCQRTFFRHACKLGFEGIVSKRLGSPYRSGRSRDWLKMKNPNAPAVKREAEEDWGRERWR